MLPMLGLWAIVRRLSAYYPCLCRLSRRHLTLAYRNILSQKRSLAGVEMGEEGGSGCIPMSWAGLVQPPSS
eukprot:18152-Eustigmatos_ZCMA.PRE.1